MTAESPPIKPRCLIVDDEERLRTMLVKLMQNEGFTCLQAANGVEALALLAEHEVTLVMSDIRMPVMDGMALLDEIRSRWPEVSVVMITALNDVEMAVRCLSAGAMDYLVKPFSLREVRARVAQALEKRQLLLEVREFRKSLRVKVGEQARRIEELFLVGIQSLAEALELKDPYTRGHSERVTQYATAIARELGLDEETQRQIELGAQLHDIGKIGVREFVLNNPGALTDAQYAHIMTHPMLGYRLLYPLLGEAPGALKVVRSHHERFDGSGVPDQLIGDAIPLEARIVTLADALDAMTSERRYRTSTMDLEQAVTEILRCTGTQFDPPVVDAFISAVRGSRMGLLPRRTTIVDAALAEELALGDPQSA